MSEKDEAEKAVKELNQKMCGYTPGTLHHIKKHNPELAVLIRDMDQIMVNDGALDRKTKRLIAGPSPWLSILLHRIRHGKEVISHLRAVPFAIFISEQLTTCPAA
jgi:hypothetical protein